MKEASRSSEHELPERGISHLLEIFVPSCSLLLLVADFSCFRNVIGDIRMFDGQNLSWNQPILGNRSLFLVADWRSDFSSSYRLKKATVKKKLMQRLFWASRSVWPCGRRRSWWTLTW